MNIIKPNSAYPSFHDGLRIYSGISDLSLSTGQARTNGFLFKTDLRQLFFASFTAIPESSIPVSVDPGGIDVSTIPNYKNGINNLGYLATIDPQKGSLNISVVVPNGYRLMYYFVGSQDVKAISSPEIYSTSLANSTYSEVKDIQLIINNVGTTGLAPINNSGATFTFQHLSNGHYQVTSSSAIFNADKLIPSVVLEGVDVPYSFVWVPYVVVTSSTTLRIDIIACDADGTQENDPPARIFLKLQILP